MRYVVKDKFMEFSKSIITGVEIKRCRNDPHAYKSHIHNELSLGYIVEGSTEFALSDRILHYGPGDGIVIPPLMTHRCAPEDIEHWAYVMLFVDPAYYGDGVIFSQAKKFTGNQAQQLTGFIERLLTEKTPDALEDTLVELLLEFSEKDALDINEPDITSVAKEVHTYILRHVRDEITLEKLEQIFGISKFTVIRTFQRVYLTTPAAYHLQHRVAEAKKLLSKGVDVFDVCAELRFYDQAHLIREHKKMYGVTPAAYRKQLKR